MVEDWITTTEAAQLTGFHPVHIRRLALADKVHAKRFGRAWMVSRSSLMSYLKAEQARGEKRGPKPES